VIARVDSAIPIDPGMSFMCAGVKFTLSHDRRLCAVGGAIGARTEIDLLGTATLTVPPEAPAGTPLLSSARLGLVAKFLR
jgi:hypothetical protein